MLKEKLLKNKKRLNIVSVMALCLCVGTLIGGKMIVDNVKADENLAKAEKETVVVVEDEATVDDEAKDEEAVADENKEASKDMATAEKKDTSKKETAKKEDSNKDNSKPAKKEESNKSNTESKPKHTHSWTAVYKEVDNGYYKTVTTKVPYKKCTGCGADITSNATDHHYNHAINGEASGTTTAYRYSEYKEWVPKIEKAVDYYKCSCGATK